MKLEVHEYQEMQDKKKEDEELAMQKRHRSEGARDEDKRKAPEKLPNIVSLSIKTDAGADQKKKTYS